MRSSTGTPEPLGCAVRGRPRRRGIGALGGGGDLSKSAFLCPVEEEGEGGKVL